MDRSSRINRTFLDILAADERMARQEERLAALEESGMHNAAACARETLMVMADRFLALCTRYESMMDTARMLEDARRAKAMLAATQPRPKSDARPSRM